MKKLVVHCKKEPYDVYIGRPGPWGNPFSHKDDTIAQFRVSSREEAIKMYEEWLISRPDIVKKARQELKGKVLGCWCDPQACHGHVLAHIANEEE